MKNVTTLKRNATWTNSIQQTDTDVPPFPYLLEEFCQSLTLIYILIRTDKYRHLKMYIWYTKHTHICTYLPMILVLQRFFKSTITYICMFHVCTMIFSTFRSWKCDDHLVKLPHYGRRKTHSWTEVHFIIFSHPE